MYAEVRPCFTSTFFLSELQRGRRMHVCYNSRYFPPKKKKRVFWYVK